MSLSLQMHDDLNVINELLLNVSLAWEPGGQITEHLLWIPEISIRSLTQGKQKESAYMLNLLNSVFERCLCAYVCVSVYHICAGNTRPEEGIWSAGAGFKSLCELLDVGAGTQSQIL